MKTLNSFKNVILTVILAISFMTVSVNAYADEYYDNKSLPMCCDNVSLQLNYITTTYTSKSVDFQCYTHGTYDFCNETHKTDVYHRICINCGSFWETVTKPAGIEHSNSCHK